MPVNKELIRKLRPIIEKEIDWKQGAWREIAVLEGGKLISIIDFVDETMPETPQLEELLTNRCRSAMCVAGWAVELDPRVVWALDVQHSGKKELGLLSAPSEPTSLDLPDIDDVVVKKDELRIELNRFARHFDRVCYSGEKIDTYPAMEVAQLLLGLDRLDSRWLFDPDRQRDEILAFFDLVLTDAIDFDANVAGQVKQFIDRQVKQFLESHSA